MTKPSVTIVDYGVGNIASIAKMFEKAGARVLLAETAAAASNAERLVLPGVGAFDACATALRARSGMIDTLFESVAVKHTPLLGICVGMQLLASASDEGKCAGLGLIGGVARRFDFAESPELAQLRIPHMSWAVIEPRGDSRLFADASQRRFYFVHSYHVVPDDAGHVSAWATYGRRFAAAIERDNVFGVQFHPEKSHKFGLALFRRFLEI